MSRNNTFISLLSLSLAASLAACAVEDHEPKTEIDPDTSVVDGKADVLTRNYVEFKGDIAVNGAIDSKIDYPDWLHGYTFRLEAGDKADVYMNTDAFGYFFVYGPSHRTAPDGTPRFRRALHRAYTDASSDGYRATYTLEAEEAGTYLVVYGPAYVWSADYHIEVNCPDCRRPGECFGDNECASGQYCGDNGARCITYPCDVNFNICKPLENDGAWCDRDEMCTGFCGWDSSNERVCKAYSQAGERCGGFVLPEYRSVCAPGLDCVYPEPTHDVPGTCTAPE